MRRLFLVFEQLSYHKIYWCISHVDGNKGGCIRSSDDETGGFEI